MAGVRRLVPAVVAAGVLAALAAAGVFGGTGNAGNVGANLVHAVGGWKKRTTVVDLAQLTPFPWTRVFVFGRWTSADEIDAALGQRWRVGEVEAPAASHARGLLVFLDGRRVVREVALGHIPRFACIEGYSFTPRDARFLVTTSLQRPRDDTRPELVPRVANAARQRLLVKECRWELSAPPGF
jgi:hypothetical protein